MFNKKNKTKSESEYLKSARFHTMKNDLSGETVNSPREEDYIKESPEVKGGSPFLSKRDNLAKMQGIPEREDAGNELLEKEDKSIIQESIKSEVPNNYPHIRTPQELYAAETKSKADNSFEQENGGGWSVWGYTLFFIIILLLGAGGYYLWSSKSEGLSDSFAGIGKLISLNKEDDASNSTNSESDSVDTINDLSDNKNEFSDKANFMVLGDEDSNFEGIGRTIANKFAEMEKYKGRQLEFLVVDKNNKPIIFNDFADKFKITLSSEITGSLASDNFSLFLYQDKNIKRIGLVMAIKNKDSLKTALTKNEKRLIKDFNSLFLYEKPDTELISKDFSQSEYNGNFIRYANLNKSLNLSLDYSISGEYLVVATSKDSGRLIVDKIASESIGKKDVFSPEK